MDLKNVNPDRAGRRNRGSEFVKADHADELDDITTNPSKEFRPRISAREEDDAYPVVCSLGSNLRVIACRHGLQWILQRAVGGRWRAQGYCATRKGLERLCPRFGAPVEAVAHLPEHIRWRA